MGRPLGGTPTVDVAVIAKAELPIGAGRVRGLLLHKLMEEVLTGELREDLAGFGARARALLGELVIDVGDDAHLPDPKEMATTAWRTLQLPDVAAVRAACPLNGRSTRC